VNICKYSQIHCTFKRTSRICKSPPRSIFSGDVHGCLLCWWCVCLQHFPQSHCGITGRAEGEGQTHCLQPAVCTQEVNFIIRQETKRISLSSVTREINFYHQTKSKRTSLPTAKREINFEHQSCVNFMFLALCSIIPLKAICSKGPRFLYSLDF
jgi:hypothetical protein